MISQSNNKKKFIKIIRKMILGSIGIILTLAVLITLFINLSPQFGGSISKERKVIFEHSINFKNGKFSNLSGTKISMGFTDMLKTIKAYLSPVPNTTPTKSLPQTKVDSLDILAHQKKESNLIWFGHSTFLLQLNGKNILLDPMFGSVPAPHPMLGNPRFNKELPIEVAKLPQIDAVVLSHDHYDHLDYESIMKLKDKVKHFYTPLGVGTHLQKWGISEDNITELDWWEVAEQGGIQFRSTPAQHFSGRGILDHGDTQWCSWVITSASDNIFFSGDSGYNSHFTEIGDEFGPFDMALMECGQYNDLWSDIHMMPEQTVQAAKDIRAKTFIPIHWGAFKLAMHSWTDPIERVSKKAAQLNIAMISPLIGERVFIQQPNAASSGWWHSYVSNKYKYNQENLKLAVE